ncbi:NAD(P)-binding protein [Moniliophthora roreri MCA 2997]|uniref:NAD(P)-binding protein n=1 Tax=Moniliophthora roreri (strain MCA 2997) TaxID=1381753 RepID=V2X0X8_MONRO|nr:NAD(P)-binding protein [Moniliophthora roreri MCA 2997]
MPSLADTRTFNASFDLSHVPVAVFVGGTAGIGASMARALSLYTHGSIHIIIAGRNESAGRDVLGSLTNPTKGGVLREFVFCDYSLLKSVHGACEAITSLLTNHFSGSQNNEPPRINFLTFSANYASLANKRNDTAEGLDLQLMIRYYHRFQMTCELLPLLHNAGTAARVMSILGAGGSCKVPHDDYGFRESLVGSGKQGPSVTTVYTDVGFEEISARNPSIGITHIHPGFVRTSMVNGILDNFKRWYLLPLYPLLSLVVWSLTKTPEDSAEYMIYALLNGKEGFFRRNAMGEDLGKVDHGVDKNKFYEHSVEVVRVNGA